MRNVMNWFSGVVEDRFDPQELGRVRVRIFGLHTDDVSKIPTNTLPWAHVMMPPTSASISGVGLSPTGLVEGSWVVGFFADGENCQDPIVMGSIHGKPTQPNRDRKAFKDTENKFPRWLNDTDVSYVARGKWKQHDSYAARSASVISSIDVGTAPIMSTTVSGASEDARTTWSEPNPRNDIEGNYPYVHVWESESGIIREHDDTPGGSRITEYHPSGTFYEIYPDGKKMTKVVGDNYEIMISNENILIRGNQTITVEGDVRQLVKGNYTLEVSGNYNLKVHGNRNTKITANDSMEINGNYNLNVEQDFITRVGSNTTLSTTVNKTETIGGTSTLSVTGAADNIYLNTLSIFSNGDQNISTNASQQLLSKSGLNFNSQSNWTLKCNADMIIQVSGKQTTTTGGTLDINAGGNYKVTAPKIDLN
jgi:hypothetical protein